MKYSISEEALVDIEKIWLYTYQKWSKEQADRYYNLIFDEIEYISQNFEAGIDFSAFRKGYKFTKVKSHLLFYRKSRSGRIEVIRVLHTRMNILNRL